MPGRPCGLQNFDFKPLLLLGSFTRTPTSGRRWPILVDPIFYRELYKNTNKLRSFYKNLLVGDWPILCGREQAFPRTSKDKLAHCCSPIIDGGKFLSRTPKCYLWQSWAHNPEDSKIDPLVRADKRQANREPSLVVGVGHISWLIMGLLALTRQKQLAMSRQAGNQQVSQHYVCLFQDCLSCRNSRSAKTFAEFLVTSKKWDRKKQLMKINFCHIRCLCMSLKACPQWTDSETSPKGWFCKSLEMRLGKKS